MPAVVVVLLAAVLVGCGSRTDLASYPPQAGPAVSPPPAAEPAGSLVPGAHVPFPEPTRTTLRDGTPVMLDPHTRMLTVGHERVFAGAGPTHVVAGNDDRVYVTDTAGGAVLLFRTRPELKLWRRAAVPGAPYGTAIDPQLRRIWVTLTATNEAVALSADGAPRIVRRFPTVRQPDAVTVDETTVFVRGRDAIQAVLHSPDA